MEHNINALVNYQLPPSISLEAVKIATVSDTTLELVKKLFNSDRLDLENELV